MVTGDPVTAAAPERDCLLEGLREPAGGCQVQGSLLATRFTILYFHAGSSPHGLRPLWDPQKGNTSKFLKPTPVAQTFPLDCPL